MENTQVKISKPFALYYTHNMPHWFRYTEDTECISLTADMGRQALDYFVQQYHNPDLPEVYAEREIAVMLFHKLAEAMNLNTKTRSWFT